MNALAFGSGRLHTRVAGTGPTVLCLHSSAGSSQQWEALAASLAPDHRVVRVDAHGHGRSPQPAPGAPVFAQDVHELSALVAASLAGVHLVGHSYGAALAVSLALAFPRRVRSLALYEPVLFSLLDDARAAAGARAEIARVGRAIAFLVRIGQPRRAAHWFLDYWAGAGSWTRLEGRQKDAVAARMAVVARHFESLFAGGVTLAQVHAVQVPTLLLAGAGTRASARAVIDLLATAWPHAEHACFAGLGHLGPITHAASVNPVIARFLDDVEAGIDAAMPPRVPAPPIARPRVYACDNGQRGP